MSSAVAGERTVAFNDGIGTITVSQEGQTWQFDLEGEIDILGAHAVERLNPPPGVTGIEVNCGGASFLDTALLNAIRHLFADNRDQLTGTLSFRVANACPVTSMFRKLQGTLNTEWSQIIWE